MKILGNLLQNAKEAKEMNEKAELEELEKLEKERLENQSSNSKLNDKNADKQNNNQINYFILYNGYEIKLDTTVQELADMQIDTSNNKKYNTTYYNYENGKYVGETKGIFGEETYEGVSRVDNVKKIAISKKYNAIPREYTVIKDLPEQLKDMSDCSTVDIHSIDLDGDNKKEYIVCYTVNYAKGAIGDGEPEASSGIILLDSNYKKIDNLVSLENGFWGNIKEEDKKVFLSLDDVDYIDIDNDGIIEIIIRIPTYEGTKISIVKYENNISKGETNIKASVEP